MNFVERYPFIGFILLVLFIPAFLTLLVEFGCYINNKFHTEIRFIISSNEWNCSLSHKVMRSFGKGARHQVEVCDQYTKIVSPTAEP